MALFWERRLDEIREELLLIASMVERAFWRASRALIERNSLVAETVITEDAEVDRLQMRIDEMLLQFVSRHATAATDARLILTVFKAANDFESIADEATTIARRAKSLNSGTPVPLFSLPSMKRNVHEMLKHVIDAFDNSDLDAARQVIEQDHEVDRLYSAMTEDVTRKMIEKASAVSPMLDLLAAAKAIERIGDRAKNIAEEVIYLYNGNDVRHQRRPTSGRAL